MRVVAAAHGAAAICGGESGEGWAMRLFTGARSDLANVRVGIADKRMGQAGEAVVCRHERLSHSRTARVCMDLSDRGIL